ncbi:PREDICTED: protein PLASTID TRANSCRIPTIONALLY ACTIVE 7 isoform X2 [Theobroma cacao]|uniref:Protein PLASTID TRANSCRIPTIONALLY ACTIVE 7 isoform X2 n=2 Tax=Theobroma cacao TaxID=3641 RepID=A0AB32VG28_THECC|nr:PREDICTED: protein PLASTID TRANSCRIPTIONALLY ACTIVE 7 isoform X2 [Theobroma cacao]EOY23592.1 Plastid transcriptionally active7 isoform 2 [Theobroma cacao]
MAFAISNPTCISSSISPLLKTARAGTNSWRLNPNLKCQTKKDEMLQYKLERIPFLEEQVRKIREGGKLLTMDIERLLLSEDNRFDFVNDVAAEAKDYIESNRDEYGGTKKAILHVLSNRVNDSGFYRPDAYAESDPFKPGPTYLKEEFT